ncbi:PDZ domain-containing protein [Lentibacillus cibarius]|uniref:PDZ domain-containing protein n=1 Tax=Lentibacillus cibarius TaxID=2583219 RepID=A0A549YHK9_9BACI|nr:trypsin-like peptidase domain-containing protein [Lentibacillus cibarius]TRM11338.1 PDZ domain-containing protein [Lentibacillus cibarius]
MERNDNQNEFNEHNQQQQSEIDELDSQERQDSAGGIAQTAKQKTTQKETRKKSGSGKFTSGLVGAIISAAIVTLLFSANIIPVGSDDSSESTAVSAESESDTPDIAKTISSDDAAVAGNIQEATEAVVGVVRMQQQSIWEQSEKTGAGSGIIYKKEDGKAYVVTNEHVVDGANEVEIVLNNDNDDRLEAKVLGSDRLTDLAVLQVDGSKIDTVANLGSSGDMQVGDTAVAIGNPLGMNFANTVTKGIVSGLERSISVDTNGDRRPDWITEVIQTDAAINPGNSGGALINADGEVIGINSMKIARREVEGIGFAIPIDSALPVMKQLEKDGQVARPYIGISTASVNQVPPQYRDQIQLPKDFKGGMVVARVETGSPADNAGLQQFDVITKINGNKINSLLDLRKFMYNETKIGDKVKLEIYRNGKSQTVSLKLVERKES